MENGRRCSPRPCIFADRDGYDLLISDLGLPDGQRPRLDARIACARAFFPRHRAERLWSGGEYSAELRSRLCRPSDKTKHHAKPSSKSWRPVMAGRSPQGTKQVSNGPPRLPASAFDVAAALNQCLGDRNILDQMIQYFFSDFDTLLPQIHAALAKGRFGGNSDISRTA